MTINLLKLSLNSTDANETHACCSSPQYINYQNITDEIITFKERCFQNWIAVC